MYIYLLQFNIIIFNYKQNAVCCYVDIGTI